ncbi:MAG TPA: M14 family zinc carboxypeptidase, partial [Enhygromyxa sp.]|nr:M14 family zinc carboxypeptidase [Enhygromyxa sp.]
LLQAALTDLRLVCVPLVNPVGMWLRRRSNQNGVDLMRNAPAHPDGSSTPLLGGQQLSDRLPFYRGRPGQPMELEARVLCEFVREWVFGARHAIVLDVHSGFGSVDRLWFPYAYTRRPFPSLAEAYALERLLDDTMPNHIYVMEPVSRNYLVAGDLWDYLYDQHGGRTFMPLTLELGSWSWVKKNPRQLLDVLGGFNPIRPHRLRRTLRRHLPLIEFLLRAVAAGESWTSFDEHERARLESEAHRQWFSS